MADKFPDDPLDALNFSIDDDDLNFSPVKTIGKSRSTPTANIPEAKVDDVLDTENKSGPAGFNRRRGGSGDWLGLKDPIDILGSGNGGFMKQKTNQSSQFSDTRKNEALPRAKTVENVTSIADPVKRPGTAGTSIQPVKKRSNILDELFGDGTFIKPKEKPVSSFAGFGGAADPSVKAKKDEEAPYLPSLSERRQLPEKRSSKLKVSTPSDWLFDAPQKSKTDDSTTGPRASVSSPVLRSPAKKSETNVTAKETTLRKNSINAPITEKLDQSLLDAPIDSGITQQQPLQQSTPITGPPLQPVQIVQHQPVPFIFPASVVQSEALNNEVIEQLSTAHAQLGAAMARHQQSLQSYMQAILSEACRVGLKSSDGVNEKHNKETDNASDNSEKSHNETPVKGKRKKDLKADKLKMQDVIMQEMEVEISKTKLQVSQLELKIANMEEINKMEIESLKKTHGFEISTWETRHQRALENFDEVVKEYEEKIAKLKKKIEELEKQHEERINVLQAERMSDLEKLGEFHRVALEQAASITLPQGGPFKIPLRILQKPGDEIELAERESTLLEKEKQVEMLHQRLHLEKLELDEALEKEKIRKEEREREMRRVVMEAQLKEEMLSKEYDRKKARMDALQSQIEQMRDEVLKEQGDLTREKLALASEKAKMEAMINLERGTDGPQLAPLDLMRARAELEAALEAAREARDAADLERRRHVELRKSVEEAGWAQKEKELELESRERSLAQIAKEVEVRRSESASALDEAQALREEIRVKQVEIQEQLRVFEAKEKVLSSERMEIARERVELEKKRSQLNVFLPELEPDEELVVNPARSAPSNKEYIDPKALILRLKAEKDLHNFISPFQGKRL